MDCRDYKYSSYQEEWLQKTPSFRIESRNTNDEDWKLFALHQPFLSELAD